MTETGFNASVSSDSFKETLKKIRIMQFENDWEVDQERFVTYEESDLPYLIYAGKARRKPRFDTFFMNPTHYGEPPLKKVIEDLGALKIIFSSITPPNMAFMVDSRLFMEPPKVEPMCNWEESPFQFKVKF